MKIYCCFTPAHEILLRQEFLPSIPETFSVHAESIEVAGPGDFLSPEFLHCINQKISLIIESLRTNLGDVIVWADIDIRVFSLSPSKLASELGEHDIAFQREGKKGEGSRGPFPWTCGTWRAPTPRVTYPCIGDG